jgi:hypothetical protein
LTKAGQSGRDINIGVRSQISCIAYDTNNNYLAVGCGEEVYITKETHEGLHTNIFLLTSVDALIAGYTAVIQIPRPVDRDIEQHNSDNRLRPRGLHFMKKGTVIIVSYLNHGVV